MNASENERRYLQAADSLCKSLSRRLLPLTPKICESVQEIRLRLFRPLSLVCPDNTYFITKSGGLTNTVIGDEMICVTKPEMSETFNNICNYSVYNRQNEIVNGFVTMRGGHRAGICGTAVENSSGIVNIRDITSINIRISREHKGCAEPLYNRVAFSRGGVLVCGPPCSGKTTVLRDLARLMSIKGKNNVALVDERGEFAGTASGKYQNDIGLCDIYDSYKKSEAMIQAVRSMSPDVIICDEIGTEDDISAVQCALNCGVRIISSVHCSDERELRQKKNIEALIKTGAFSTLVFLSNRSKPGEVVKVVQTGESRGV